MPLPPRRSLRLRGMPPTAVRPSSRRVAHRAKRHAPSKARGGQIDVDRVLYGVEVKAAGHMGKGLFARCSFQPGEVVVGMGPTLNVCVADAMQHVKRNRLPHDSFIEVKGSAYCSTFGKANVAAWYHMNHADEHRANCKPCVMNAHKGLPCRCIVFVARRTIRKGTQLCWSYGQPDPRWA